MPAKTTPDSGPPLVSIARRLAAEADALRFGLPVTHVYDPLVYARVPHEAYLGRYGADPREVLFLGMNPGPWGMTQTGVPFGEVTLVRDWLGIAGDVDRPRHEHPRRPVHGFACTRSEVSGARFWSWARDRFGDPDRFFDRFFVANYCPLAFMEESGRNRTPDKLPADEKTLLFAACDRALRATVQALGAGLVIGVGAFAEARARAALNGTGVGVSRITHPSPANPAANRDWRALVDAELGALGVAAPR